MAIVTLGIQLAASLLFFIFFFCYISPFLRYPLHTEFSCCVGSPSSNQCDNCSQFFFFALMLLSHYFEDLVGVFFLDIFRKSERSEILFKWQYLYWFAKTTIQEKQTSIQKESSDFSDIFFVMTGKYTLCMSMDGAHENFFPPTCNFPFPNNSEILNPFFFGIHTFKIVLSCTMNSQFLKSQTFDCFLTSFMFKKLK